MTGAHGPNSALVGGLMVRREAVVNRFRHERGDVFWVSGLPVLSERTWSNGPVTDVDTLGRIIDRVWSGSLAYLIKLVSPHLTSSRAQGIWNHADDGSGRAALSLSDIVRGGRRINAAQTGNHGRTNADRISDGR